MSASENSVDHLIKLIEGNKFDDVKQFVESTNDAGVQLLATTGTKGFTPLHSAVFCSHSEMVTYILSKEVNVDLALGSTVRKGVDWYEQGSTALHIACSKRHGDIVEALLAAGATPDVVNGGAAQHTPLHVAAEHGYLAHAERLILAGSSPAMTDQNAEMPIHKAARNGHSPVVMYFVTNGAEVNPTNKDGFTPLMLSVCEGYLKTSLLLLENGADISFTDNDKNSPLTLAILNHQEDIVALLLDNEVNPNAQNCRGDTALHIACQLSQASTVEILLEVGVDVDAVNNLGQTPLHLAAISNNYNMVSQLVSAGVQTDIADDEGKLAVDWTTNGELIAMITTGIVSPPAPQREKTILNIDSASLRQSIDPSTTTNTNTSVYTADGSTMQDVADPMSYSASNNHTEHTGSEMQGDMTLHTAAVDIASHTSNQMEPVYVEPAQVTPPSHATAIAQQPMEPRPVKHRQPANLRHRHPPSHENQPQTTRQQFQGQQGQYPGQFQQAIKIDKTTVDTLRQKVKSLESQILTLGIGDDKAVVLYRQYGKLNEEINLARQMVRDYVLQHRPLTPRMENIHVKSNNCSSPMDLPTPRQGASTPRNNKHSNNNGRKFNPNFMVETVESLKSELQILRNSIKPTHIAKLNMYISQVESMALAVVTFAHMMAVTVVL